VIGSAARQRTLAAEFAARHQGSDLIVLPNAFDAATARLVATHHPVAVGTTSAGIAAGLGFADGERAPRELMLEAAARIVASVDVGVTVDIEAGYGDERADVRQTVAGVIAMGAIGCNIEDVGHPSGPWAGGLLPVERAMAKISAAREEADAAHVPLVINARTDTFLEPGDQVEHAIERGNAYLAAGADCVFAPGVGSVAGISRLVAGLRGPLNVYAGPGVPPVSELNRLGVRRVSVGCGPYQACLALIDRISRELLVFGRYDAFTGEQFSVAEMTALFG
jgi:2-methylisocitrate lyase-like PEP mutase family enzyme